MSVITAKFNCGMQMTLDNMTNFRKMIRLSIIKKENNETSTNWTTDKLRLTEFHSSVDKTKTKRHS